MVVTILLVAFGYSQISESYRGNIFDDAATAMCIVNLHFGSEWNQCSYDKMYEMYGKMKDVNCINCDKYFHCQSNYNAIYTNCPDASGSGRDTAINVSNCRDSPDCTDQDCLDDREANEYGQNGRDCASKYLCSYKCAYNPADDSCLSSNCPRS